MNRVLGMEVGTGEKEVSAEKRSYLCDKAEMTTCWMLSVWQRILAMPLWVALSSSSEVGSKGARPIPGASVTWKEEKDRGRRARSSGVRTWRHGGRSHTRNPSGGEDGGGGVQSCCRGLCVLLMEKYEELEFF